ncbi:MAG: FKBP-type peptidyl-prolyl cis-trans isomerase [Prolixibacteraceae bacterium]|nr:FKBP-type peptidyl-prolyl cis-trans isomerase [Prolixibacteraceae bacterium]
MEKRILKTNDDKLNYALGMSVGSNLISSGITTLDVDVFSQAVADLFKGEKPLMTTEEANDILENFMNPQTGDGDDNLHAGLEFLAENSLQEDVVQLPSGLQYKILQQGSGDKPVLNDTVRCHYHGTLIDGTVFDSSVQRGIPAEFPVSGVIQGWVEALQFMPEGSKYRLFIPPALAYGQRGAGSLIAPNSTLIFDVELLKII